MPRAGRDLELIVSRLEAALAPSGAVIKSPDFIEDKVTGIPREVDVSIRYQIGTVPILVTIECRDHADPQDDTWLEQLVTKRLKIGAAKTIAVSSSGFTAPAVKHAALQGIELRRVEEITDDEIRRWFRIDAIQLVVFRSELFDTHINMHGETPENVEWDLGLQQRMKADPLKTPVFQRIVDEASMCVDDLIRRSKAVKPGFFFDVPRDGTRIRRTLNINFPPNDLRVLLVKGGAIVASVQVTLDLFVETLNAPLGDIRVYADQANALAYAAEAEVLIVGDTLVFTVVRRPESGEISLGVTKVDR